MAHDLTHASWFSGVGGIDLGLERAGWRTVLHSEIDPYAASVLARHWPGVPNLGDILAVGDRPLPPATLWSGGFPCQDLSTAGHRAGMARGTRSGLAHAFLDLVELHRPPAVLLENVAGLLSSHRGRDLGTLVGRLGELGYGWAYRVLDAAEFGVPMFRRRVFVVALHSRLGLGSDAAAEVLSIGAGCGRHPSAREDAPTGGVIGSLDSAMGHHGGGWPRQSVAAGHVLADGQYGPPPHPHRVRAMHGMARRLDDRPRLDPERYRCVGNGVAAPVSHWIGARLRDALEVAC